MYNTNVKHLQTKKLESGVSHGQFEINSLKVGQGVTVGNQLRRVLLNDIEGIAISAVKILNIEHEFSIIPGIREDVLEILLNLKGIVLSGKLSDSKSGYLKIQGPTVVTADCIQLPDNIKIINPSHYLMSISTSNTIEMKFQLESGTGYQLASQTFTDKTSEYLQLDTIFMPVQKVNFKVNIIQNNYDKYHLTERLTLDIWTNGSISPSEALLSAAQITIQTFSFVITNKETEIKLNKEINYSETAIEILNLSRRTYNSIKKAQINTIDELTKYSLTELSKLKNIGKKALKDISYKLKKKLGINLKK
uniref:DNA-directed RNA polymerase subunit alpha n=1 Tax=Nitzschia alba TaxID=2858 RepID=A0A5C0F4X5_NITAL|nr:DNA-directed RNA polymerase alpha subunit [Nitzschia alba]QEI59565.1 DNA-directed RNA polymerase alpha subunit [Nitzschia alba]